MKITITKTKDQKLKAKLYFRLFSLNWPIWIKEDTEIGLNTAIASVVNFWQGEYHVPDNMVYGKELLG